MVWGGDEAGVEFLELQKLAVISKGFGAGGLGGGLVAAIAEDVADGGDVDLVGFLESAHDALAAAAGTDEAELNFVVCAEDAAIREGGPSRSGPDEIASNHAAALHDSNSINAVQFVHCDLFLSFISLVAGFTGEHPRAHDGADRRAAGCTHAAE